jgi:hypothetical protein
MDLCDCVYELGRFKAKRSTGSKGTHGTRVADIDIWLGMDIVQGH